MRESQDSSEQKDNNAETQEVRNRLRMKNQSVCIRVSIILLWDVLVLQVMQMKEEHSRILSDKQQLEESLSSLSEAYNALERDYNELQGKLCVPACSLRISALICAITKQSNVARLIVTLYRNMDSSTEQAEVDSAYNRGFKAGVQDKVAGIAQTKQEMQQSNEADEVQKAFDRGVEQGKADLESACEQAKQEALESTQANVDDLFACLGEVRWSSMAFKYFLITT